MEGPEYSTDALSGTRLKRQFSLRDLSLYVRESFSDFLQLQPTLHRKQMPHELLEPAIESGYRATEQPWRYYFISLFQIHNETVNVWTHLLGFVAIWWCLGEYTKDYDYWEDKHSWPTLILGISCLLASLGSAMSHLLHSRSVYHHYTVFMFDYMGVTLYAYATGIQSFFGCSDRATYKLLENIYPIVLLLVTLLNFIVLCLAKIWYGHDPHNLYRKFMQIGIMTIHAVTVTVPFAPRYFKCYFDDDCSLSSLNHLSTNYALFISCAFFFGTHLPERMFPGNCDILGQGHQIFHVLTNLNQISQFHAMRVDIQTGAAAHANPDLITTLSTFVFILISEVCLFIVFEKMVSKKTQHADSSVDPLCDKKLL